MDGDFRDTRRQRYMNLPLTALVGCCEEGKNSGRGGGVEALHFSKKTKEERKEGTHCLRGLKLDIEIEHLRLVWNGHSKLLIMLR